MKRTFLLAAALLAIGSTAFAKGQRDSASNGPLELMYRDSVQKPVIDAAIAEFEEAHPGVVVEASIVPWAQYWDKLQTSAVAGSLPDVFWMNVPNFPKYAADGILMDFQPRINADGMDTSVYPQSLISKYSLDNNIHAIPEQFDTVALAYNKAMFDQAGLAYPNENWTWEDLREAAKILTKETPEGRQYGFLSIPENHEVYYNFMVMNGGRIISEDAKESGFSDPESIQAIRFLTDPVFEDGSAPEGSIWSEQNKPHDLFFSGKAAMCAIGSWRVPTAYRSLGENVDIAPLPKSPFSGERKTIIHGLGWAADARTDSPDMVWKFVKHLTSAEFSMKLAESGITTPSYRCMAQEWVAAIPSMNLNVFIEAQEYSHPYPVSRNTAEWMAVEIRELKDAWMGYKSVDEAMSNISEEMNRILAAE